MKEKTSNIVVVCGPTASGKTGLALQLAKELVRRRGGFPKVNILSVDSRQAYQDLDIITGKDIPADLSRKIAIFGHDIFRPDERANLADFTRYSHKIIRTSTETKTPLIIVGGTGLYLKALTQNLTDITTPPNPALRLILEKLSLKELQSLLQEENPPKLTSLNRSDFMNPRRLIRAIEISKSKIGPSSNPSDRKNLSFHWVGIRLDGNTQKTQIHHRVLHRIKQGGIQEVSRLLKKYPDRKLPIFTSLGVSQIIAYLDKKITKEQLVELWTNAENDYARRQDVWFKKQPGIVWYDKDIDRKKLIKELSLIYQ